MVTKKKHYENIKILFDVIFKLFTFKKVIVVSLYNQYKKNTYLSLINLKIIKKLYKKTSLLLKTNSKLF
jgi:hypothetical protein